MSIVYTNSSLFHCFRFLLWSWCVSGHCYWAYRGHCHIPQHPITAYCIIGLRH